MSTVQVEQALAAPADEVGRRLLSLPEDQWVDRKSARIAPRDLAPHVVAFGNAEGGTIAIGLHGGKAEGTDRMGHRRNDLMQVAMELTEPAVRRAPTGPCPSRYSERSSKAAPKCALE